MNQRDGSDIWRGEGKPSKREGRGEGRSQGGQIERLMGLTTKCEMRGERHLEKRFVFLWACVRAHALMCACTCVCMCVCVQCLMKHMGGERELEDQVCI